MRPLIIIGCSAHGRVVLDAVLALGYESPLGWIDDSDDLQGKQILNLPVLGKIEGLPELHRRFSGVSVVIAVGDNWTRAQCWRRITAIAPNCILERIVHPSAIISPSCELGVGTVVTAGAVIGTGARVGTGCIVNTRASLDHDCVMGDFASLAPGAIVGGNAEIGLGSAVGIGAVVANGVKIGCQTVIGAGSVVVRSIPDLVVAYGAPARVVRSRGISEPYLTAHLRQPGGTDEKPRVNACT